MWCKCYFSLKHIRLIQVYVICPLACIWFACTLLPMSQAASLILLTCMQQMGSGKPFYINLVTKAFTLCKRGHILLPHPPVAKVSYTDPKFSNLLHHQAHYYTCICSKGVLTIPTSEVHIVIVDHLIHVADPINFRKSWFDSLIEFSLLPMCVHVHVWRFIMITYRYIHNTCTCMFSIIEL